MTKLNIEDSVYVEEKGRDAIYLVPKGFPMSVVIRWETEKSDESLASLLRVKPEVVSKFRKNPVEMDKERADKAMAEKRAILDRARKNIIKNQKEFDDAVNEAVQRALAAYDAKHKAAAKK